MEKRKTRNRITITIGYRYSDDDEEHRIKVPVRKEFVGKTMKEARQKRDEYLQKMKCGLSGDKQYFAIVAEHWREEVFCMDGSLSPNTITLYNGVWEKYIKNAVFYPMKLSEISPMVMQNCINNMIEDGIPLSSIRAMVNVLSRLYKYLEVTGMTRNFMSSIVVPSRTNAKSKSGKFPLKENEVSIWTNNELDIILNSFEKAQSGFRLRFLIVLASQTGCRISELLGLEYSDFNLDSKTLSISKQLINCNGTLTYGRLKTTSSYRTIPLTALVIKEFEIHREWHQREMRSNGYSSNAIFTTKTGEFVDRHNATSSCNRYYDRIGVQRKGFHTYRHTFCTRLCEKGVSIETVAALAGHRSIDVTAQHYVGVSDSRKAKALQLLSDEERG